MKAKDTVMGRNELLDKFGVVLNEGILNRDERLRVVAEAQAEISFKAGYKQGVADRENASDEEYKAGIKAGIKEVVEYLKPFTTEAPFAGKQLGQFIIHLERPDWRAKLKEWGIDDVKREDS